jgi:hypothetical protein
MTTSSMPYKRKRTPKGSTETIAKRFCDRASPESSIGGIPEDDISQVLLYEKFQHLELSAQKQYFDGICKALHDQEYFSKWCPRIDMIFLQHYDKDNRLSKEEVEEAYALQEDLKEKWRLSKPPAVIPNPRYARPRMSEHTYWYDNNLHWSSDKSEFELGYAQDRERRLQYKPDATENLSREYGFLYHISSSLLWYRIAIFMGEIENSPTDHYKSFLDMRLWHVDGVSTLRLWDSKGGVRGRFDGLKESQTDALQFLNFVAGFKFPHTYDGVIAGTVG